MDKQTAEFLKQRSERIADAKKLLSYYVNRPAEIEVAPYGTTNWRFLDPTETIGAVASLVVSGALLWRLNPHGRFGRVHDRDRACQRAMDSARKGESQLSSAEAFAEAYDDATRDLYIQKPGSLAWSVLNRGLRSCLSVASAIASGELEWRSEPKESPVVTQASTQGVMPNQIESPVRRYYQCARLLPDKKMPELVGPRYETVVDASIWRMATGNPQDFIVMEITIGSVPWT